MFLNPWQLRTSNNIGYVDISLYCSLVAKCRFVIIICVSISVCKNNWSSFIVVRGPVFKLSLHNCFVLNIYHVFHALYKHRGFSVRSTRYFPQKQIYSLSARQIELLLCFVLLFFFLFFFRCQSLSTKFVIHWWLISASPRKTAKLGTIESKCCAYKKWKEKWILNTELLYSPKSIAAVLKRVCCQRARCDCAVDMVLIW